ncbi:hypothetical protein TGAM01_v206043, partial [Trichoderma gamsii]
RLHSTEGGKPLFPLIYSQAHATPYNREVPAPSALLIRLVNIRGLSYLHGLFSGSYVYIHLPNEQYYMKTAEPCLYLEAPSSNCRRRIWKPQSQKKNTIGHCHATRSVNERSKLLEGRQASTREDRQRLRITAISLQQGHLFLNSLRA